MFHKHHGVSFQEILILQGKCRFFFFFYFKDSLMNSKLPSNLL